MQNRWSQPEADRCVAELAGQCGPDVALRTYSSRLLGGEPDLVLHGGGNTSTKGVATDAFGAEVPALFIKASGFDMASIVPAGHPPTHLERLRELRRLDTMSDEAMVAAVRSALFDARAATPSIETLMHAFLPQRFIDLTHADAILARTNQPDGAKRVEEALGPDVIRVDYVKPGFLLAKASADAFDAHPEASAMVWMNHGAVTWGETAREAYDAMIELVTRAETYLDERASAPVRVSVPVAIETARRRFTRIAPILRGLLAEAAGDPDRPHQRVILSPLVTDEVLSFLETPGARALAETPTLTPDHLIRTRPLPLVVEGLDFEDPASWREQLGAAVADYARVYRAYCDRHASRLGPGVELFEPSPRMILVQGLGAACAGKDARAARIVRDITEHTLRAKSRVARVGSYLGLPETDLFDMEYWALEHAKLRGASEAPLARQVVLVTGAAGAIGAGVCRGLLERGAHVAASDLPGDALDGLGSELAESFGERVLITPLDTAEPASVEAGFAAVVAQWGGVDAVVVNAGVAAVSPLRDLDLETFRRVSRVNTEGTLLVLREAARQFELGATGGDIVLVSTKNVFAPGAQFGAYSASKAAAHQLGRIASQELAPLDVRVNMVAPDAVFEDGARPSGLWQEVGPSRMAARGLDPAGLREYYRERNLLKARVTADHVARAVAFFLERATPTTGATLPVDGGLPDATPR